MIISVLDRNFVTIKVIDTFESLIWTDRFQKAGDFELYMSMDVSMLEYIKQDYYLWSPESEHIMIIETLNIISDIEEGNKLVVTGRSLESLLDRRIVWKQTVLDVDLQNGIKKLLDDSVINPELSDRKMSNFVFKETKIPEIEGLRLIAQYTGDNLYEVINDVCSQASIGYKIRLTEDNKFEFSLYAGTDRSYNQIVNPYVIFSPGYENIMNSNYLESKSDMKNVTLVAGEGEGAERKTMTVGSGSGLDRRELFTDARDISSDVGNGVVLSDAEYAAQLNQRGLEKLAEHPVTKTFDGTAETSQLFVYGEDFFIGDTVQIANEYGHEGTARITELITSVSADGISRYPTFEMIQKEDNV